MDIPSNPIAAGAAVGALLLSEIDNALIVAAVPPQYNTIVVGLILIAAVAIDHIRRERLSGSPVGGRVPARS